MAKKAPYYFSQWEGLKPNFPFNLDIHEIKGSYESHRHIFLEFFFLFEGSGTEIINGKPHSIKPGTFSLILPYQVHELHSSKGEVLRLYNCSMKLEAFFGPNKIGIDLNNILFRNEIELPPFVNFEGENAQRVLNIFKDMRSEFDNNFIWSSLMFKSKITELLVLFDRLRRNSFVASCIESARNDNSSIWDVVYYLHSHYSEDITLSSLSRHFYMNPSYLSTLFKKFFGKNFKALLNEIRVLHACSLLSSTDLPVTQIAFDVGFKSYSSFCRVFMQNRSMNAVEYRKLMLTHGEK